MEGKDFKKSVPRWRRNSASYQPTVSGRISISNKVGRLEALAGKTSAKGTSALSRLPDHRCFSQDQDQPSEGSTLCSKSLISHTPAPLTEILSFRFQSICILTQLVGGDETLFHIHIYLGLLCDTCTAVFKTAGFLRVLTLILELNGHRPLVQFVASPKLRRETESLHSACKAMYIGRQQRFSQI